jgi:hypothetical protein
VVYVSIKIYMKIFEAIIFFRRKKACAVKNVVLYLQSHSERATD